MALAFLAVTHRYKRTHCLWLEQFQIADSARMVRGWPKCSGRADCRIMARLLPGLPLA
jgi:hypothetical protein